MPEASVSAGFAAGLLRLAVSKGADSATLLARAAIDPVALDDRDARIPFAKYVALMRAAKEASGDPALALHYGEINIAEVSIIGLIGQASSSMTETFTQLNRYVPLVVDVDMGGADRFEIRRERGGLWFVDTRPRPNDFPELTESAFSQFICGPRKFTGGAQWALEVHVTHPAPAYKAEYDRVFQAPVTFDAGWNALKIDERWMGLETSVLPRYVFGVLTNHAEALLKELENSKSVRGRVENLLMPTLHKGEASMEAVAAKIAMSRQTLFRKLKAEGTTFEKVLDELRHRLALDYLGAKKVSVNEAAYLVGFSDPAAFSRAFKRWTGMSPRAMREKP